ncbi:MAG: ATP-binding protein [Pseudonocardiales bacterium]
MVPQSSGGPVADFCAALRRLQQDSGLSRAELARRVRAKYSRTQLYTILDSEIRRPPEWDRVVEPLVRACTNNDERKVAQWRRRHGDLVRAYDALRRQDRQHPTPEQAEMARVVPAQLPADVDAFTGRTRELAKLDRLLAGVADRPAAEGRPATPGGASTAVVITAVSGTAGVGKTALAVRWAHRVRDEFPDGQLYVNLRGYDTEAPLSASEALGGFLRALGLAGPDIPVDVDERAAAYRSLLDERRMLVVLDNASSVDQIRLLLPGAASCLVLVTSRDSLAGLVARHGATRLDLDLLAPQEAVALLRALIGRRVQDEPAAAATLARQCAWLPLALRVAAELAAARPDTSLAELVAELGNEQRRLEWLDAGGDPRTAVRGVFSWSYQRLPAQAARVFRLLGLHPGPDLDAYAAAALTDRTRDQAQHLLDLLVRGHLLAPIKPGRYGMHDLLRAYATQLSGVEDSEPEQRAALTRLFDHYLATAAAAMDTLVPAERHRRPRIPESGTLIPPMANPSAAQAWLDTERATLTAACAHTASHGWPGHTTRLATILFRYLDTGGHYTDALAIHTHALHAARHTADRPAQAHALTNLGLIYQWQGYYQQAIDHLQQALSLARELGDRDGEAHGVSNLGMVYQWQGRHQQAADHHQQALSLARELGDRDGEAQAVTNLGIVCWRQGYYLQAIDHLRQALPLFRELGDQAGEAQVLNDLGLIYQRLGQYQEAADHLQQALTLARGLGYRAGEGYALGNLGIVYERLGYYQEAAEHLQQALSLARELGHRAGEGYALDNLGDVYQRLGQYEQAVSQHQQALAVAREVGHRDGEGYALSSLGLIYQRRGHDQQAIDHLQQALSLFSEIGNRDGEARTLDNLGIVYRQQGQFQQAIDHHRQALSLSREIGNRRGETRALNGAGEAHHASTQYPEAHLQHTAALNLATQIGDRYEQARAHHGLAHTHHVTGNLDQARHHYRVARTLYTDLGVPETADVQACLTTLDQADHDNMD